MLAIGSYGGAASVWDIADRSLLAGPFADVPDELFVARRELKAARPPHVTSHALGNDTLISACGGNVRAWDGGRHIAAITLDAGVDGLCVVRDGDAVAR